jgi:hypothetical protein
VNDARVRDIIRAHRDGGPISRLYATGEISPDTIPALGVAAGLLELDGQQAESERLGDVIRYARDAGERPPVPRWLASHSEEQPDA